MNTRAGGKNTYYGTIKESEFVKQNEAGDGVIDIDPMDWVDLDWYAAEGYRQASEPNFEFRKGAVLVTAQYTPRIGLNVWSKPRGEQEVNELWDLGEKRIPDYIKRIDSRRELLGPEFDKEWKIRQKILHSEDGAAIGSADEVAKKDGSETRMRKPKFVDNTRAVTYGMFSKDNKPSVKAPCGSAGTQPDFRPTCAEMCKKANIGFTTYKGSLGKRPKESDKPGKGKGASEGKKGDAGVPGEGDGKSSSESDYSETSSFEAAAAKAADDAENKMDTDDAPGGGKSSSAGKKDDTVAPGGKKKGDSSSDSEYSESSSLDAAMLEAADKMDTTEG
jgi:hypothetical protein